ncbi:DNA-processing protein DprA [Candidatus Saccharibacteria bacterium]|nr:DNA-processing protein DprA [Candidatus Saccharibacteria bacterium]
MLTLENNNLPERLLDIPSPPKKLFLIGDRTLLESTHTLSVVGTRKVTAYGQAATTRIVKEVANCGVVIVSGLALGVDSIAHKAALEVSGKTIAVLPAGLDKIYPSSHRNLALSILEGGGLLISEYPPGTPALKQNFIARNRIVSGLGDGVLITEASKKSGTIHTANFGLEQGKTIMAIPGNITSPMSEGTNSLIKTGAILVTSPEDVLFGLGLESQQLKSAVIANNSAEESILEPMRRGITEASKLLVESKLNPQIFNQTLSMLEITGRIRSAGGSHWVL